MRFRNTIIVLVLAALVGAYAYYSAYNQKPEVAQKVLNIQPSDIAKIELKYPDREIELERPKGGDWKMVKPIGADADQTTANNLARAIADATVTKTLDETPTDLSPFGLAKPATVVTVTTYDGKQLPGIEVGKTTPIGFSAYIKTTEKPAIMLTSSAFPAGMNKTVDQLRSRDLMTFKVDDITKVIINKDNGQTIEIDRDGDKWRIVKPGNYLADPTQVRQLLSTLVNAKVADFIGDAPSSVTQYGLEKPHLTVTVYGKGAASESLLFGFKQSEQGKDGIYVRRGERTPVYTVHQWVVGSLDRSVLDLRDKTVFSFQSSDVDSAAVKVGSDQFTLKRSAGGKWDITQGGKTVEADVAVVERFLDELRDLKGVSIVADPMPSPVPFGLDQPAIAVTLMGKDGKNIGTVKLSKITVKPTGAPEPGSAAGPRTEYYADSSAGTAVYSISDFSFSQLNKPSAVFHTRSEATPAATPQKK
ncbi:MAG TPA: DUF4340 domain-containing protein [Candidatus Binataceae bacterium]|nr:DUF4340 domain-containing protein [Candidatus Binataceae bacterium]